MNIVGLNEKLGNIESLSTLVTLPERGTFGKASYRGNYAGGVMLQLVKYLTEQGIQTPYLYDPMVGGGTTKDVAEYLGLPYVVDDIHYGFDVVNDELHDTGFDLAMLHYPYWKMIDYAGDLPKQLQQKDMSRMQWKEFIEAVSHVNAKVAANSKYVAVLVGDMAYQGGIKSIQREMAWIGKPIRHIIKLQHNAQSYTKQYKGKFIPIVHEHLILFQTNMNKQGDLWLINAASYKKINGHDHVTWKAIVKRASQLLKRVHVAAIMDYVKEHYPSKLENTNTPHATIRRTLQELVSEGYVQRIEQGIYNIA